MSTTGHRPTRSAERKGRAGFTLIELILVMAVLVIVLALVAPSLSNFFRGRSLDSEARRFVSLTRYAESRAVSEGVPMLVWIDPEQRSYGLTEEVSYTTGGDTKAVTYELARDVVLELVAPTSAAARREQAQASTRFGRNSAVIRFQPDGLVTEGGPAALAFKPDPSTGRKVEATDAVWVARTFNGLHYEIPTNQLVYVRR
jgi:type II secretion system protein H